MSIKDSVLFKQIQEEINEDMYRFVEDIDSVESWMETCIDCPSDDLIPLLKQIPEDEYDKWMDCVMEEVNEVGQKLITKMEEEEEEEEEEE